MNPKRFDEAFENFSESRDFEDARNVMYSVMRLSFIAGWKSAGGEPPPQRPPVHLTPPKPDK